jgi:hypothetical protein
VVIVLGLIFSFSARVGSAAASAAVTAYLLARHPAPTRSMEVAMWTTTAVVAVPCLIGLYVSPLARLGWR